jgi:hypothetical protein
MPDVGVKLAYPIFGGCAKVAQRPVDFLRILAASVVASMVIIINAVFLQSGPRIYEPEQLSSKLQKPQETLKSETKRLQHKIDSALVGIKIVETRSGLRRAHCLIHPSNSSSDMLRRTAVPKLPVTWRTITGTGERHLGERLLPAYAAAERGRLPPFTWSFQRPRCWPVPSRRRYIRDRSSPHCRPRNARS